MSKKTITIRGMQKRATRFIECQNFEQLALLLRTPALKLLALANDPEYREFYVPKKNGNRRLIEDPVPRLKRVQRKLNDYLQAVYYFHRTRGAYGFLSLPVDDPSPRNIFTNASQHLGCKWLLNVDMKDFFHLVTLERATELFSAPLLNFEEEMARVLAGLCCYKGRLPMGAPTSPILSNLASIPLDQDLQDYADDRGWTYTRYADDISFSADKEITQQHIKEINDWVKAYDYLLNPTKIKLFSPEDTKIVTGLVVGAIEVGLTADYEQSMSHAITQLGEIVDAKFYMSSGRYQSSPWVKELQQQVQGKLAFARHILGEDDEKIIHLEMQMDEAMTPPREYGPVSWLEFGYDLFK